MKTYAIPFVALAILVFAVLMMRDPVAQELSVEPGDSADVTEGDGAFRQSVERMLTRLDDRIDQLEQRSHEMIAAPAAPVQDNDSIPAWGVTMRRQIQELERSVDRLQLQINSTDRDTDNLPRELDQLRNSIRALETSVGRLQLK
ncbi:hypothetical protein [Rubripirellula reticaptiva]|uniref:Uncharacterized protein n=1 Tax=Rubripirellula reticaptiva TaxID=2528013 RepID=A0A5C6F3D9_9BACT|nr:hypothetical protein [Rubripirellula reticaptiva]TWU55655.1 hypothetical protein Poly59_19550 [Rubripirellula reticaptiva]